MCLTFAAFRLSIGETLKIDVGWYTFDFMACDISIMVLSFVYCWRDKFELHVLFNKDDIVYIYCIVLFVFSIHCSFTITGLLYFFSD